MENQYTAGLILVNRDGGVLLQLRDNLENIAYPNHWTFFGGHSELGESPKDTVKRELLEELGYELENPEYFGSFTFNGIDAHVFIKYDPNFSLEKYKVLEGQRGEFFSYKGFKKLKIGFNDKDILMQYFEVVKPKETLIKLLLGI